MLPARRASSRVLDGIRKILEGVGGKIHGSLDKQYEQIERELIVRVAKPNHLTGGEPDRVLFQNASDIMVRLLCP
jgi:hypothetical protein